jgi:hypothetical protein
VWQGRATASAPTLGGVSDPRVGGQMGHDVSEIANAGS